MFRGETMSDDYVLIVLIRFSSSLQDTTSLGFFKISIRLLVSVVRTFFASNFSSQISSSHSSYRVVIWKENMESCMVKLRRLLLAQCCWVFGVCKVFFYTFFPIVHICWHQIVVGQCCKCSSPQPLCNMLLAAFAGRERATKKS